MFTFFHRIFVYGYHGKSSSNRGRPQRSPAKTTSPPQTFFSTICPKSAASGVFIRPKVTKVRKIEHVKDPRLHKNVALRSEEPQALKMLQELLNIDVSTQERQLDICKLSDDHYDDTYIRSYLYFGEAQDTNEKLYFTLLGQYIEQYLPIIKTPIVSTPCKNFGLVYKKPKSIFINIQDKGNVYDLLGKWPENNIRAIIVTESGRILGHDDQADRSALGMGIPMSKLALYTALAGIKPNQCLPITLDVGTDNLSLLDDPTYIGLKRKRVRGEEYNEFIDEFMDACVQRFGPNTLVLNTNNYHKMTVCKNENFLFSKPLMPIDKMVVGRGNLFCNNSEGQLNESHQNIDHHN